MDNDESWQVFDDDDHIISFLEDRVSYDSWVIDLTHNKYPKGLVPLENAFSPSDAHLPIPHERKFTKTIDETKPINIGDEEDPKPEFLSQFCFCCWKLGFLF